MAVVTRDIQDIDMWARAFEERRPRLLAVARRVLGSTDEAEDAVQEAWIRLHRSGAEGVENLGSWLTTVVCRVCVDMLRARGRRDDLMAEHGVLTATVEAAEDQDPERAALLADSLGWALLLVLDTLDPDERLALVLHDTFAVPFTDIASIIGRSPAATRQLTSRARRRVHATSPLPDLRRQHRIVTAFLAAARHGEFGELLSLLAPDATMHADATAIRIGAVPVTQGAEAIAKVFHGGAEAARVALIDGAVGLVWQSRRSTIVAFRVTVEGGRITAIHLVGEPAHVRDLDIAVLDAAC